jgi:tetratricopeptide (TPR) repeat protein
VAKVHYALDDAQYAAAMKDAVALMVNRTELLTSANWLKVIELRNSRPPAGVMAQSWWFTRLALPGTAYDAANRAYTYERTNHLTIELIDEVRALAPYDDYLLQDQLRLRHGPPPSLAELQRAAGPLADYNQRILYTQAAAAKDEPSAYVPIARRICDLEAENCRTLAHYLADHDRDREAADVYQRWADKSRDRVGVANGIGWLITYYDTHGDRQRAIKLADDAAAVYSYWGLVFKARLLERMGKYPDAEAILKQASERYDKSPDLTAFYARWARQSGDPGIASAADALVAKVFPGGIQHVEAESEAGLRQPIDGVKVTVTGARGAAAGFHVNDIIVAVDGLRVHNYDQFYLAWSMSSAPAISFLRWQDGKYSLVNAKIRDSWNSGVFVTYGGPKR